MSGGDTEVHVELILALALRTADPETWVTDSGPRVS